MKMQDCENVTRLPGHSGRCWFFLIRALTAPSPALEAVVTDKSSLGRLAGEDLASQITPGACGFVPAGSLLLLLGSALALCPNVASHPACLKGAKCQVILQDLYDIASSLSSLMYIRSVVLFQEFERVYAQDPLYFVAAISMCDTTTHIPISTANDDLKEMQTEDIIRVMFRLLSSCDDPLKHLAQEAHRLPKFNHSLTFSVRILSDEIRKLQELTKQIVHQEKVQQIWVYSYPRFVPHISGNELASSEAAQCYWGSGI
ncbi:PREDICTED: prolactin-like [Chinchilla lanigera]|uniref:prolactin-like n=1 Tax=Chinchilla lanigera TaxID=34839 RepID=UPI0006981432|nr:PREDICTED: prolactin-like [Chinchilla lanigera]